MSSLRYTIAIITQMTPKIAINNAVSENPCTDARSCPIFPPANVAINTTASADPIAAEICLTVLLIAVASSTSPDTIAIVHVVEAIKPKPAPIVRMICVTIMYSIGVV